MSRAKCLESRVGQNNHDIDVTVGARCVAKCLFSRTQQFGTTPAMYICMNTTTNNFAADFASTFSRLDKEQGEMNYITMFDLRAALPSYSRQDFDSGLNSLRDQMLFSCDSADGRHCRLPAEQLEAGILESGSYLVYVARREQY